MIRSVYTPADACHPGGDCCDNCRGHHHLGDTGPSTTTCDAAGNCYQVTSTISYGTEGDPNAPIDMGGAPLPLPPLNIASPAPAVSISGNAIWYVAGALLLLIAFSSSEPAARKRR